MSYDYGGWESTVFYRHDHLQRLIYYTFSIKLIFLFIYYRNKHLSAIKHRILNEIHKKQTDAFPKNCTDVWRLFDWRPQMMKNSERHVTLTASCKVRISLESTLNINNADWRFFRKLTKLTRNLCLLKLFILSFDTFQSNSTSIDKDSFTHTCCY